MIRWMICDDAEYLCKSFQWAFEDEKDLKFLGYALNSESCMTLVKSLKPDIILLDIQMETPQTGISLIPQIEEASPLSKIIMLTNYIDDDYVFSSFVNGAQDYVQKTQSNEYILKAIRNVYENKIILHSDIAQKLVNKANDINKQNETLVVMINVFSKLSQSELEVLSAVYYGDSYKQIAAKRFVEDTTIRTLASRILKKFKYKNMARLIQDLRKMQIFEYLNKAEKD